MNNAGISFEQLKADMLKDDEFKTEYERLQPEYDAIEHSILEKEKSTRKTGT